jgi:hypothetical protein
LGSSSLWLIVEVARIFGTLRRQPMLVLNQASHDPLDTLTALQEVVYSRFESANTIGYIAGSEWEDALHRRLGVSSESLVQGFWLETLRAQGMAVGPFSFHGWNDGGAGFLRAIWSLIRQLRPLMRQRVAYLIGSHQGCRTTKTPK